jgi:hypothetical protein
MTIGPVSPGVVGPADEDLAPGVELADGAFAALVAPPAGPAGDDPVAPRPDVPADGLELVGAAEADCG